MLYWCCGAHSYAATRLGAAPAAPRALAGGCGGWAAEHLPEALLEKYGPDRLMRNFAPPDDVSSLAKLIPSSRS